MGDRSPTATLLCSIATPRTLPASLPRFWRRLTDVLESPPRMLPSSSSPETPPSSSCSPSSPCALSPSLSSLPSEGSRQGHEADRGCGCDQGNHPQGGCWQDYQGSRQGQQEEVRSCSGATWGY